MKQKIEQLNQSYKKALGAVLQEEFPGEGIIVDDVLLDPSMQHGRVWLICHSDQLKHVVTKRSELQRLVQSRLKTRYTPKIEFLPKDEFIEKMDSLFDKLHADEN